MSRKFTFRMMELSEMGSFDKDQLIFDLLNWMPEKDVKQFVRAYDFTGFEDLGFVSSISEEDELADIHAEMLTEYEIEGE